MLVAIYIYHLFCVYIYKLKNNYVNRMQLVYILYFSYYLKQKLMLAQ